MLLIQYLLSSMEIFPATDVLFNFTTVASIPPNLKSKSSASPPIFGLMFSHFRAQPRPLSPSGSVPFLPPLHGPIRPFSFLFLSTPLPYALSPFPSIRSLLPFSFLPLSLLEEPHTQLEGLASQVL